MRLLKCMGLPRLELPLPADEPQVVASLHAPAAERRRLWKAAIKWPMYAVAVMPVLLAAGWQVQQGLPVQLDQLVLFIGGRAAAGLGKPGE